MIWLDGGPATVPFIPIATTVVIRAIAVVVVERLRVAFTGCGARDGSSGRHGRRRCGDG